MPSDIARERHKAVVWLIAGLIVLALMFGGWWLVESTNEEGTHDAELLPFFALIPLAIAAYHFVKARFHRGTWSG
jgi:hypothetical protein